MKKDNNSYLKIKGLLEKNPGLISHFKRCGDPDQTLYLLLHREEETGNWQPRTDTTTPLPCAGGHVSCHWQEKKQLLWRQGTPAPLLSIFLLDSGSLFCPARWYCAFMFSNLFGELLFSQNTLVQTATCSDLDILLWQTTPLLATWPPLRRPLPPSDSASKGWVPALGGPAPLPAGIVQASVLDARVCATPFVSF